MFSVVIPLYNKALSIEKTIESVLSQTLQDFEVVVVNDGSTDASAKIVESINDNRIRLVNQENQGVSAARNKGIAVATFEWIAFLDGDDIWFPTHLSEINKMIIRYPESKVFSTSFEYSDNRKLFKHKRDSDVFEVNNYFKEAIKEKLMWTSVVVAHQSSFKEVGGFNEKLSRGEDLDLWARLASKFTIIKSLSITAMYYVDSDESLSKKRSLFEHSMVSVIDLKGKRGAERLYLKRMLLKKIMIDVKAFAFCDFIKLIIRHNIQFLF
ncbi:glycosyltransferase family 2 protein [Pseudoalteromonas prydzensis]|uniref:glycosyltransferase family 2 protein n=1 Tax=Pseudoalteromonas prydzensis TaxID=182141 RepID=UPI003FD1FCBD